VEDPDELYGGRYDFYRNDHGIFYPPEVVEWIRSASGLPQPIDLTLRGGEKIVLSPDWELEVLALPGHSPGHLGLWDRKNKALYAGDALHGAVYRNLDGQAALCPTYANIPTYLQTIRFIEGLDLECYVGCHWPVKYGQEIDDFCEESRQFVLRAETSILRLLSEPRTLKDICLLLGPSLGEWPRETDQDLVYAVWGHLCDLIERGLVQELPPSVGQPRASYVLSR
jgi:glyoxylase-like metal-dependent hydrolase (beta-lactamase superfamily II)